MEGNSSEKGRLIRKQGCEIEAISINYTIITQTNDNPFKIFASKRQESHDDLEVQGARFPKGVTTRQVLNNVSCVAKPWEILAVVGPSGAGKSSLLEILAGKASPQTGSVSVNGKPMDRARFKKTSGYVTQNDMLFPLLTVEETLTFSAKLRLGAAVTRAELASRVESLLEELGLSHVAGARVGDDRVRGISGGERRRVSIGVDVIHDPKVLILDEPTSGLDSSSALQVVDMLKTMAETRGRTVVLTIHQPGFRIVKSFNSLLFLANGSVLHHGTVDQLALNLRLMGLELPLHVNVVEFALDSIDRIEENKAGAGKSSITLQQLFQQSGNNKAVINDIDDQCQGVATVDFANSRLAETVILTHRFSKNIFRTKELFACRTVQMLVAGLVLGSIFHNLKDDLVGARERVGLFAFILTFLLSSTIEALPIFLQERDIVMKETSCGSYRVSSYAIANGLVYLPFLLILALLFSTTIYWLVGLNPNPSAFLHFLLLIWLVLYTANSVVVCFSALVPNFIVGNSVIAGVMGSFFLFSGYFISKSEIPSFWIFMHYVSLFKYPFEGFLINEFSNSGKCLEYLFEKCMVSGEDILREEGYEVESRWRNVGVMLGFILLYRFISYVILRCRCSHRGLRSLFL